MRVTLRLPPPSLDLEDGDLSRLLEDEVLLCIDLGTISTEADADPPGGGGGGPPDEALDMDRLGIEPRPEEELLLLLLWLLLPPLLRLSPSRFLFLLLDELELELLLPDFLLASESGRNSLRLAVLEGCLPLSAAAAASALDKGMISIPAAPDRLLFPSPLPDEAVAVVVVAGEFLDDIGVMDTFGLTGFI